MSGLCLGISYWVGGDHFDHQILGEETQLDFSSQIPFSPVMIVMKVHFLVGDRRTPDFSIAHNSNTCRDWQSLLNSIQFPQKMVSIVHHRYRSHTWEEYTPMDIHNLYYFFEKVSSNSFYLLNMLCWQLDRKYQQF